MRINDVAECPRGQRHLLHSTRIQGPLHLTRPVALAQRICFQRVRNGLRIFTAYVHLLGGTYDALLNGEHRSKTVVTTDSLAKIGEGKQGTGRACKAK